LRIFIPGDDINMWNQSKPTLSNRAYEMGEEIIVDFYKSVPMTLQKK